MIYYLEPYKTRNYSILTADWSTTTFSAEFDDGEFRLVEEEKAIYLYANFTRFEPTPTTKWKPENFTWQPPVKAALIFHYEEYKVNRKEDGQWKQKTEFPGVIEVGVCKALMESKTYLNCPVAGLIEFINTNNVREAIGGNDQEAKLLWLEQILGLLPKDSHNEGFELPTFGKKKSGNYTAKSSQPVVNIKDTLKMREDYLIDIIARILGIVHVEDKITYEQVLNALNDLRGQDPMKYKVLIDFLGLINK